MATIRGILEEKDERIAQLERELKEVMEGPRQTAAAIAVDYNSGSYSPPKGIFKSFKSVGTKIILGILVLTIVLAVIFGFFGGKIFKKESITFVEHVQELSTLATAEAHMKAVIHEEDSKNFLNINLPGTKRELLLVVPATVIAGVDLKGVTSEDMVINEETKEIDITLPHAFIRDPALQMDKVKAVDNGGLFRSDIKMDEGFEKAAEAQEQIRQEAKSMGLLETAEKNAEKVLTEFFNNIGYKVNVTFK
ncbi:hypothetical protein WQ57_01455 [Mesobacillus campisalis]|uniref:DUF4230 domain-containing protein n=1 Tax=Mesobacillus campisalis TaxID=1408103 RepID=A0A0M2T4A6_9BACI|nr:DUF4230 domain-containing protein [Mesobacillus campisalis]KKK40097.1 hypothetical protein WQ57_01455 [Mesobacillus campisalis]